MYRQPPAASPAAESSTSSVVTGSAIAGECCTGSGRWPPSSRARDTAICCGDGHRAGCVCRPSRWKKENRTSSRRSSSGRTRFSSRLGRGGSARIRSRRRAASPWHRSTRRPTSTPTTRFARRVSPGCRPSRAASSRPCIAGASGASASTRATAPRAMPTRVSATCSPRDSRDSRWPSTCRRRWASTAMIRAAPARSGRSASPSTRCATWRTCSRASRSAR